MRRPDQFMRPKPSEALARMRDDEKMARAELAYRAVADFVKLHLSAPIDVEDPRYSNLSDVDYMDRVGRPRGDNPPTRRVNITRFNDRFPVSAAGAFRFFGEDDWEPWYRRNCKASASVDLTEALTVYEDNIIGVNGRYHTYGTLVHESFHLVSCEKFRKSISFSQNEGCTELLTRVLLGIPKGKPRPDVNGKSGIYEKEIDEAYQVIDPVVPGRITNLLQAYVLGDDTQVNIFSRLFKSLAAMRR